MDPNAIADPPVARAEADGPAPATGRDRRPYGRVAFAVVFVVVTMIALVNVEANRRRSALASSLRATFENASSYDVASMLDRQNPSGLRTFMALNDTNPDSIEYVDGTDDVVVRYQSGLLWAERCVLVEFDHWGTTVLERSGDTCTRFRD